MLSKIREYVFLIATYNLFKLELCFALQNSFNLHVNNAFSYHVLSRDILNVI